MHTSIQTALIEAASRLKAHSDSSMLDAELLLAAVLDQTRTYLKTWPERMLNEQQHSQFGGYVQRREQGEPIAYILGKQGFWTFDLTVTPATLVPRPETELLVEQALQKLAGLEHPVIVDLGTGSGAIALAIASERTDATVIATDYMASALRIAVQNAKQLELTNVHFLCGSWATCFRPDSFDVIVSNPPYIAQDDPDLSSQVSRHEPTSALIADNNGMADIEKICAQSVDVLKQGGWLILEHGWKQSEAVKNVLLKNQFVDIETLKDLAGHDRVSLGQKKRS